MANDLLLPEINSRESILEFFKSLRHGRNLAFHPDTPFDNYIIYGTLDNIQVFDRYESDRLDEKMCECFDWCEANGLDIYELAMEVEQMTETAF